MIHNCYFPWRFPAQDPGYRLQNWEGAQTSRALKGRKEKQLLTHTTAYEWPRRALCHTERPAAALTTECHGEPVQPRATIVLGCALREALIRALALLWPTSFFCTKPFLPPTSRIRIRWEEKADFSTTRFEGGEILPPFSLQITGTSISNFLMNQKLITHPSIKLPILLCLYVSHCISEEEGSGGRTRK